MTDPAPLRSAISIAYQAERKKDCEERHAKAAADYSARAEKRTTVGLVVAGGIALLVGNYFQTLGPYNGTLELIGAICALGGGAWLWDNKTALDRLMREQMRLSAQLEAMKEPWK